MNATIYGHYVRFSETHRIRKNQIARMNFTCFREPFRSDFFLGVCYPIAQCRGIADFNPIQTIAIVRYKIVNGAWRSASVDFNSFIKLTLFPRKRFWSRERQFFQLVLTLMKGNKAIDVLKH